MTESAAAPTDGALNTSTTRIALSFARTLTGTDAGFDPRIPEKLPPDPTGLTDAIGHLERAAADYAVRAHEALDTNVTAAVAYPLIVYTRSACDLMRDILSYGRAATGDRRPAHIAVEAVLLGALTWRLASGADRGELLHDGVMCSRFMAGRLAVEALDRGDHEEAVRRHHHVVIADRRLATPNLTSPGDVTDPCGESGARSIEDPQTWRDRADVANATALFHPVDELPSAAGSQHSTHIAPSIEVAGVRCGARLNGRSAGLTVSVDTSGRHRWLAADPGQDLPVEVLVNGQRVFPQ